MARCRTALLAFRNNLKSRTPSNPLLAHMLHLWLQIWCGHSLGVGGCTAFIGRRLLHMVCSTESDVDRIDCPNSFYSGSATSRASQRSESQPWPASQTQIYQLLRFRPTRVRLPAGAWVAQEVEVAFGGVAAKTIMAPRTEAALRGLLWDQKALSAALQALQQDVDITANAPGQRPRGPRHPPA